MGLTDILIFLVFTAIWSAASLFLTVVLHETGHLIGGLLGGYRLSGFAVMGFMLHGGRLTRYDRKALNAGQCFMYTDEPDRNPSALVLGGCVMNLTVSVVLVAAAVFTVDVRGFGVRDLYLLMLLLIPAVISLVMGLVNLFFGSQTSDGKTFAECRTDLHRREYNHIMAVTGYLISGLPFSRMPEDLFSYGDDWRENSLSAEMRMYCYWRECEMIDTLAGYMELAAGYGFDGNSWKKGRFFLDENMTEAAIYAAIADLEQKTVTESMLEPRSFLPGQLAAGGRHDRGNGPCLAGLPFPGLAASYIKCLDNGLRMIGGKKLK